MKTIKPGKLVELAQERREGHKIEIVCPLILPLYYTVYLFHARMPTQMYVAKKQCLNLLPKDESYFKVPDLICLRRSNNPQRSYYLIFKTILQCAPEGSLSCSLLMCCFFSEKWPLYTITHLWKIHRNSLGLLGPPQKRKMNILRLYNMKKGREKKKLPYTRSIFCLVYILPRRFFSVGFKLLDLEDFYLPLCRILDSSSAYSIGGRIDTHTVSSSPIFTVN